MQRDRRIETRFGLRGDENEDSWEIQAKKAPQEAVEKRKNADAVAAPAPAAVGHMVSVVASSL
jgi:hypothetical protein